MRIFDCGWRIGNGKVSAQMSRKTVLFLQLPRLDHDVRGPQENVPLASVYLRHALETSGEGRFWDATLLPRTDDLDDRGLVAAIRRRRPDVIAATLYLWNVERTIHVLRRVRRFLPRLKVIVGGPEVAEDHPFLLKAPEVDFAVTGEGEILFPQILRALRDPHAPFTPPTRSDLGDILPPPGYRLNRPDANGMAYLETTRGCPLRCAFCAYGQRRQHMTWLPAEDVLARVRVLLERGAREIRFVDPTFNSNPEFGKILAGLARLRRRRRLTCLAELRAETLTADDARMLARAGFREIEVGVQSRNPATLRRIRRPTDLAALDRGIRRLARAGILVTVDLMYGLPGQDLREIRRSLEWAARLRGVRVQCLQTLLLPGTELRRRHRELGLCAPDIPPYHVMSTPSLSGQDLARAERLSQRRLGILPDVPTERFVGRDLPDLFRGRNRRAVYFRGRDLFARRGDFARRIRRLVAAEPHILWQFVLEPEHEEPLDLLDLLIAELRHFPALVGDRFLELHSPGRRVSRRIMVRLRPGRRYGRDWQEAAEELLRSRFF